MFQDKYVQAILDFALNQQKPFDALGSLIRAGKLANVYRPDAGALNLNYDTLCSKTKNRSEALETA